jgi:Concanavalin A-like lectin/glucanases superfamily
MKPRLLLAGCLCLVLPGLPVVAFDYPQLSITNASGDFTLSWPESGADWFLEESSQPQSSGSWRLLTPDQYQANGTMRTVCVAGGEGNRFYRLRRLGSSAPELSGSWALDEGVGDLSEDAVGSGVGLSLTNLMWSSGRVGRGGLRFNGAGVSAGGSRAWVNNRNNRVLQPAGPAMSVSLWFNPESVTPGWRGLAGNDTTGTNGWQLALHSPGPGTNHFIFSGKGPGNWLSVTGQSLLLPGQWHQLTVTHDGITGSIYLDGALLAQGVGGIPIHDGPVSFGGGVGSYDSFLGRMDNIRTYTNCLTTEQVSLVGEWNFNEGSGVLCADRSVEGHHGILNQSTAWVPGWEDSGLDLKVSQLILRNDDRTLLPPSGGSFSLSFWLRPGALAGTNGLMSCGGWQLTTETTGSNEARLRWCSTNLGGTLDLIAPASFTDGTWTKLDLTYNGGIASIYVNGRKAKSDSGGIRGSAAPLVVGAAPYASNFDGVIDGLKIYNRERQAHEIGPVAETMWETVLLNTSTNIVLRGFGPADRSLSYTIVPAVTPTNGTVTHTPGSPLVTFIAGARKGPDAFTYTVSDGVFTSDPTIVVMSVVEPHWLSTNGGSGAPLDGSSAERAWAAGTADALAAIWHTNNYYDCFFYAPGTFQTRGWRYLERPTANTGCKHIGAGPEQTTLRLVEISSAWGEEVIFSPAHGTAASDNFEVQQMHLDCNATNLPKYTRGEPHWIRIPLASPVQVGAVTLRWGGGPAYGSFVWQKGRAQEFTLSARRSGTNTFVTNYVGSVGAEQVTVLPVGAEADELYLELELRAAGVDFYSLAEIEITGAAASLPVAMVPGAGTSRLDSAHPAVFVMDDDPGSAWASGPEAQAQVILPLGGDPISQINLTWNCQSLPGIGRLGPAAQMQVRAWNELAGQFEDLPFVRHGRTATGTEAITFGNLGLTNSIQTSRLLLLLTAREAGVEFYSIRHLTAQNGLASVAFRLPSSSSHLPSSYSILIAFDGETSTQWACGTRGMVGALNVRGSNLKFRHLKITGFGTTAGRECFVLGVVPQGSPQQPMHVGNVLVEDCHFKDPAPYNPEMVSTLVVIPVAPSTLTNALVRRCAVTGMRNHFFNSQGIQSIRAEECLVENCHMACYYEPTRTDNYGPILIRSNRFVNVTHGIYVGSHADSRLDSFTVMDNEFVLSGFTGTAFAVCDTCHAGPSATITNVTLLNNLIRYTDWTSRPYAQDGGLSYTDMRHAVLGNNVVALGTTSSFRVRQCPGGIIYPPVQTEDCDLPGPFPPGPTTFPPCVDELLPGYRRAWFNNRDLSGNLLGARIFRYGTDGPATGQQWPE